MHDVYTDGLGRAMPTLFVAGPAKSGSTFLWECIHQSFHPQRVCDRRDAAGWSDEPCERRRFVLPPVANEAKLPGCLKFQKESSFWRYWGRRPHMTWRRYGGPSLPISEWQLKSRQCNAHRHRAGVDTASPPKFATHRAIEDACLQGVPCNVGAAGRLPYAAPMPSSCMQDCTPCAHHPGWVNNVEAPCAVSSYRCASATCSDAPYVPKALRRANYSAYHARAFAVSAFASLHSLRDANITASRLISIEGNPGMFQTPPRHARALAALTSAPGRRRLRFIVGWRDPFDLAYSLWAFLATIGQEGKRVEHRMDRAFAAVQACNDTLAEQPMLLLDLSAAELAAYRTCLDDRPRSRHHFYIYGGLYALHLLSWLHLGFGGEQFLFVRMSSLPREAAQVAALQAELAAFLGLQPPVSRGRPAERGVCLSATMITSKGQRLRAHNATVKQVKRSFRASPTATTLQRFFAGHNALLEALLRRERVRVY